MFDFDPSFLARLHPRRGKFHISQNRTVFQVNADGVVAPGSEDGLFVSGTRLLSAYRYLIDGKPPQSNVLENVRQHSWLGYYIAVPPDFDHGEQDKGSGHVKEASQQTLELRVSRYVEESVHEDIDLTNFTQKATEFRFELELNSDFADQDELQEGERQQRGELTRVWQQKADGCWELDFDYYVQHVYDHQGGRGVASLHRGLGMLVARADSTPSYEQNRIVFAVKLAPRQQWHACIHFVSRVENLKAAPLERCVAFFEEGGRYDRLRESFLDAATRFRAPSGGKLTPVVISLLERAKQDLAALRLFDLDHRDHAWVMAAGLPIYIALFGRDTLTTAWEAALLGPEMMLGTLAELPRWQGTELNDWRDEQPGRMLHEAHDNPLEVLGFKPHARYYGSITTSAFYPVVVSELWHWTGKKYSIYPLLYCTERAIEWLDQYTHLRDDGFYYYQSRSQQGGRHQGWKDSNDAIVDENGSQVEPPIATCEEQGFVYASKLQFSEVLWWMDKKEDARRLYREAQELKKRFNEAFWMEDETFFALGLDSKGRQIRAVTSNPGHCLATGIADQSLVEKTADRLLADDMFSGWGIRTLSSHNPAYNPYSYHRGSIWPVEHGAFAMGFMRYGLWTHLERMCKALFEASAIFDYYRLPEVFSGHPRDAQHPFPALYPKANWPQAWSASAMFSLLQAMLGLYPYAPLNILIVDPHMPEWFPEVTLEDLRVGDSKVTIRFYRKENGSSDYQIAEQRGPLHVLRQPSPWSLTAGFGERLKDLVTSITPRRITPMRRGERNEAPSSGLRGRKAG
jgi:glycogen debranching enzyme